MIFIFLVFLLLFLIGVRYNKTTDKDHMRKSNTTTINGFFIVLVFFSHFKAYGTITGSMDISFYKVVSNYIGQLMVTTFFFFSGYGIYESIKSKGKDYIKNFTRKRFVPLILNWVFAISLFVLADIAIHFRLTVKTVLLSYIGWSSIGNSNWYIFDIFILYIFIIISFNVAKKRPVSIAIFTLLSAAFVVFLREYRYPYWYNTLLCFPFGMWYSYFKDKIIDFAAKNNVRYYLLLFVNAGLFAAAYLIERRSHLPELYCLVSLLFAALVSMVMMKFSFNSKIFEWFGKNLFWIYILQRIPMMVLKRMKLNVYLYFIICLLSTLLMTLIVTKTKEMIRRRAVHKALK